MSALGMSGIIPIFTAGASVETARIWTLAQIIRSSILIAPGTGSHCRCHASVEVQKSQIVTKVDQPRQVGKP